MSKKISLSGAADVEELMKDSKGRLEEMVELSSGSAKYKSDRVDARLSDHPNPSNYSSFFGAVFPEELKKDFKGHLRGMEEESSAKYNFDFSHYVPPEHGRFEWQIMNSKGLPEFHSRPRRAPKDICLSGNNNVDLNENHNCLTATPCQSAGDRYTEERTEKSDSPVDFKDQCSGQRKRPASRGKRDEKDVPMRRRNSLIIPPNFQKAPRIVLLGKTGSGTSSCGNTILGREAFKVAFSPSSKTKQCEKREGEVDGRKLVLVDTPGLFDTTLSKMQLDREIGKCLNFSAPGPHAFLVVIGCRHFTREERVAVERIREIFGKEADKYVMILFTHGDELEGTVEEYLQEAEDDLKDLVRQCGNVYHVFNNKEASDREQVLSLLDKIDAMVSANEGSYYTSQMYQNIERKITERENELRESYESKLREKERELTKQYQAELTSLKERLQTAKDDLQVENEKTRIEEEKNRKLAEYMRYYESQMGKCRQEAENTPFLTA